MRILLSDMRITRKFKIPELLTFLLFSIIFGTVWFLILYGRYSLYFTHVSWTYAGGDALQHQLGWEFFRNEPWKFPLGSISTYGYPVGTSVVFMDSIPLFAFFFKLLSPWLGENFQYFGLWELTSVIGQFFAGLLILKEFTRSNLLRILGASLLVLSPPMILRAFTHNSLSAHWILLLAIWFIILAYRHKLNRWFWLLLFGITMLIHLYYIPMLIPLWMISLLFRYGDEKKIKPLIYEAIGIVAVVIIIGFLVGIFSLDMKNLSQEGGFGQYSWNLNGFVNSFGYSAFLQKLPIISNKQIEGFSYLGLGNFVLIPIAVILFIRKDPSKKNWKLFLPFAIVGSLFIIISLSNNASLNELTIWSIQLPEQIQQVFDIFRSSARFIWPVFYCLILFGIITTIRNFRFATPILILALVLQFLDLQPLFALKRQTGFTEYASYGMNEDFWQLIGKTNKFIVVIPTEFYELGTFAVRHDMTLSSGYFGRGDLVAMEDYAKQIWKGLQAGEMDKQTIYVLSDEEHVAYAKEHFADSMYICNVDIYNIIFSKDNELAQTDFAFDQYCSVPPL